MSKIDEAKIKEYVVFQFQRNIVNFYKNQLNIIEDLKSDHRQFINKLCTIAPKEHVKNMDYFDVDKYNYIRKKGWVSIYIIIIYLTPDNQHQMSLIIVGKHIYKHNWHCINNNTVISAY